MGVLASYPGLLEGGGGEKIRSCTHMHQIFQNSGEIGYYPYIICVWYIIGT